MKTITLITIISSVWLTSCKKDYTCECVMTDKVDKTSDQISYSFRAKKNDANSVCYSYAIETDEDKISCDLK